MEKQIKELNRNYEIGKLKEQKNEIQEKDKSLEIIKKEKKKKKKEKK